MNTNAMGQMSDEDLTELYYILSAFPAKLINQAEYQQRFNALKERYEGDTLQQAIDRYRAKTTEEQAGQAEPDEIKISQLRSFNREADPDNLIGDRWLCRGKQTVLQGPTGVGKSSLVMQWAVCMALGRPFLNIFRTPPMRVMIIQAENDLGDLAEPFQDLIAAWAEFEDLWAHKFPEAKGLALTDRDFDKLDENLALIHREDKTGAAFAAYLREKIELHHPDIVFIDPLLSFAGGDIMQQTVMSQFLRHDVGKVLKDTRAAVIWVHHIGKPSEGGKGEKTAKSGKYSGLGSSEIQNVNRDVITLSEVGDGVFKLEFTKRGRRVGLIDPETDQPVTSVNIEHGTEGIVWHRCAGDNATATKGKIKRKDQEALVWDYIQTHGAASPVTLGDLKLWAGDVSINPNNVRKLAENVVSRSCGVVPPGRRRVFSTTHKDPSKKGPASLAFSCPLATQEEFKGNFQPAN